MSFWFFHLWLYKSNRKKNRLHQIDMFLNTQNAQNIDLKETINVPPVFLLIYNYKCRLLYFVLSTYVRSHYHLYEDISKGETRITICFAILLNYSLLVWYMEFHNIYICFIVEAFSHVCYIVCYWVENKLWECFNMICI